MKTEDLIATLAQDSRAQRGLGPVLAMALLAGLALSICGFVLALGLRQGLVGALMAPLTLPKVILPPLTALTALALVSRLALPVARVDGLRAVLRGLAAAAVLMQIAALITTPRADWAAAFLGGNDLWPCLVGVPLLSLPMLAGLMLALRHGATLTPRATGAVAGLAAGAMGASIYALHCPEDSPLFYATWYSVGIAVIAALGAYLGPKLLRW